MIKKMMIITLTVIIMTITITFGKVCHVYNDSGTDGDSDRTAAIYKFVIHCIEHVDLLINKHVYVIPYQCLRNNDSQREEDYSNH